MFCKGGVDIGNCLLPSRAPGKCFAVLKAEVTKCFRSPLQQKMLEIIVIIYNNHVSGSNFSSSLELPTSKRFAFFLLGGLAVLFLSFYCSYSQLDSRGLEPPLQSGKDAQGLRGALSSPVRLIAELCGAPLLTVFMFDALVSHARGSPCYCCICK